MAVFLVLDSVDWSAGITLSLELVVMIGFGRMRFGSGTLGVILAASGFVPQSMADSFHLNSGKVIEGEVLEANRNIVMLRGLGSVVPTSLSAIEKVVLPLADGSELTGEFLGWNDGVYEIRSAGVLMRIEDGVIIEEDSGASLADAPAPSEESETEVEAGLTVAMQSLPEISMKNGQVVFGQIIHATGSIVTIRLHGGGVVPTSRAQISAIRFVGEDGAILAGDFKGWTDDVYELQDGDRLISASLGESAVKAGPPSALPASQEDVPPLDEPVVAAIESTDAAIAPAPSPSDRTEADRDVSSSVVPSGDQRADLAQSRKDEAKNIEESTGAGGPVSETAVAHVSKAASSLAPAGDEKQRTAAVKSLHLVRPSVSDVVEDSSEVVFEFRLDKPADRPLVILYAATDDTAHAGQDFEAKSGVITFSTGSEYAEVRVPLIDDEQSETSEQFHLFLSGDPQTVQFSQRQIPATISDND